MKKILLSALSVFAISAVFAQVPKKPLIEHFTQASCGPCASQNPTMYATLNTFGAANYCKISYQTSWPGVDPMNAAYPAGPQARVDYYDVSGVPDCSLNGSVTNAPNTTVTAATLNTAAALTTPYKITVDQTWNSASSLSVRIAVVNVTAAAISAANQLNVAMIEDHVDYPTAPGSNGETDFYYVLRQFYNASTGAPTNAPLTIGAIPANDSLVYNFTINSLPSYIRDLSQVSFVVFVQKSATPTVAQVVHQSAKSIPSTPPGALNVAAVSSATASTAYCNYAYTPAVTFTNNDATPVTTVTAQYTINGGTPVTQTFNGNLAQGQNTVITFPATTLASGSSTVQYSITDVNSGGAALSPAAISMAAVTYSKLNASGMPAPLVEGMETASLIAGTGYSRTLPNAFFDVVAAVTTNRFAILDGPTYNLGPIGGFGNSDRSLFFNYYTAPSGTSMKFVIQKLNLGSGSQLTFNHAYRQYATENDRLQVEVSTNCGSTWTTVWNYAGAALSTLAASDTSFFPEFAWQWRSNTVNLGAYDNMNDVVIRFRGTSAYGNNLFVDDINISGATGVITIDAEEAAEARIMPNPVRDNMVLEFTMNKATDANINIVNALGQQIQQVANSSFEGTNTLEINTSNLVSGVYFLNITSETGTTTKRFVVEK